MVESTINTRIETPISQSDTWAKIASGKTIELDRSDKPILYALIRHLEARTPHYMATARELADLAASGESDIPFTQEEREMYAALRSDQELARAFANAMSASLEWTGLASRERAFRSFVLLSHFAPRRHLCFPYEHLRTPRYASLCRE